MHSPSRENDLGAMEYVIVITHLNVYARQGAILNQAMLEERQFHARRGAINARWGQS